MSHNDRVTHLMSRVLEVRYTNLEEEKQLCKELLTLSEERKDEYGVTYAYTYLGDYYIAQNQNGKAGEYLMKALRMLQPGEQWDQLRLRIYSLLAIYYEVQIDEQTSMQYYLDAITTARRLQDVDSESIILNNLGFAFQRHHKYDEAVKYYEEAYYKTKQLSGHTIGPTILSNLTDVSLLLGRAEDAKKYIIESDEAKQDSDKNIVFHNKNWCNYYAIIGDEKRSLHYADRILEQEAFSDDKLTSFEKYNNLTLSMMKLGNKEYALRFLQLMKQMSDESSLEQMRVLEERKMDCVLRFGSVDKHQDAYEQYYINHQKIRNQMNQTIVSAMKAKIDLNRLLKQKVAMESKQKELELEANIDELTGIYNRRFLQNITKEQSGNEDGGGLGYVMLDVDYFKEYNDFYGHVKGDDVLKKVASCLKEYAGVNVYPCRYGGDEFTCVCKGFTNEEVETYIKNVIAALYSANIRHEKSYCSDRVTLSIGYAQEIQQKEMSAHLLFEVADQALYESKRIGRNTYTRKRVKL